MREEFRFFILWGGIVAEEIGLHLTDMITVMYLRERKSAIAGELAEITGLTTGAMTASINRLERAGLVKRTGDAADRRKVVVQLVGVPARFKTLRNSANKDFSKLFSNYNESELKKILSFKQETTAIVKKTIDAFKNKKV
ncbi:MAG: winged helix-turn-helix transcriptional regulator [Patescibacteria group bacterium]|nr:winged helix-turn-helix transcriptional regulator [Patescibacteria group bacterium]